MKILLGSHILKVIIFSMIAGLILRLFFTLTLPVGWDGGIFLYWANLINAGATPYRDFFIRDPVYIYLVALSIRALGANYLALSLASVVPSVMTVPILYKIARQMFDRFSGLVSAVIFSFAPTILWYSTVLDERSLMLFLSVLAMWGLANSLKTGKTSRLALFGLVLGVGVFAYRGIAIYIITLPFFLAFHNFLGKNSGWIQNLRTLVYQTAVSWGSFVAASGSIFLFFSLVSSFSWMVSNFGFSGAPESAGWFIWGQAVSLSFKDRIFYVAVREWLYLLIPASVFLLSLLLRVSYGSRNLALGLASAGVVAFFVATLADRTSFPQTSYGAYEPSSPFLYAFFALLVILPGIAAMTYRTLASRMAPLIRLSTGWLLAIYWFLSTALLILLFGVPLVNYYYYFAPSLTLLAGPSITSAIKRAGSTVQKPLSSIISGRGPIVFLALLLVNAAVTAGMLYSTPMTWRNQAISSVYDIASYIQSKTGPQDEILVGNPAVAVLAHRKVALGIVQLQQYGRTGPEPFVPYGYDPYHLFASVTEISQFMAQGGVKYVVADPPLLDAMGLHPMWEAAFINNFVLETNIDSIAIFRYSPIWDLSEHLDSISAYSNSMPYGFVNGAWVDGFDHALISSALRTSLPKVGGTTRDNQVMFVPPFNSGQSFIQIYFPSNKYSNLTTSFALADDAVGRSNGVTYSVQVTEGAKQVALLNRLVTTSIWQQSSILLPTNVNVTIVLTSDSGQYSSTYDWLQVRLTFGP